MKKVINILSVGIVFFLLVSCKHDVKRAEYVRYVQDATNGLKKTIRVEQMEYSMQYKPYDYIMLMENKGQKKAYDQASRLKALKGSAWFNISFKVADGSISPMRYQLSKREDYDQRVNYFLNEAVKNIQLIYDHNDTLRPVGYLFENNYNLAPQETIVVGFSLPAGESDHFKDMQLAYDDVVFKTGIIKATYKQEDIAKIPNLIY